MTRTFTQSITGILSLIFLVFIAGRDGQAQTDNTDPHVICFGSIEPYQVDFSEGGGEGTPGSTYAWSVISGPFAGTLTPNQGPNGSSNRIVIDWGTSIAGNYQLQVIETANGCPGAPIILNIQITPEVTPTFNAIGPLCQNSVAPALQGTSLNGITGDWSPATINTAVSGTVTYTFTPNDPAQCAIITTLDIEVTPEVTPSFDAIGPLCQNSVAPALQGTSLNGITGDWSPATINTAVSGTVTYTFTPNDPAQCAIVTTLDIEVTPEVTPSFDAIGPLCQNSVAPALQGTSLNGITGDWSPATINTAVSGTVTYTFTPNDPTQCAIVTTLDIIINDLPTITVNNETICEGESVDLTASGGVTYAWAPPAGLSATTGATVSASPTATTTYTVTGTDANGCENTADATVTVNPLPNTSPIFHN